MVSASGAFKGRSLLPKGSGFPACHLETLPKDNPALVLPSPLSPASHLNRRGLQQGDLVLPAELQEARQLFGKVNDLLHRDDGQLSEMGKALLPGLPAVGIWCHGPRLLGGAKEGRNEPSEPDLQKPAGTLGTATSPQVPRVP